MGEQVLTTVGICEDDAKFSDQLRQSTFVDEHGFHVVAQYPSVIDFILDLPLDIERAQQATPDLLVIDVLPKPDVTREFPPVDGVSAISHLQFAGLSFAALIMSSLRKSTLDRLVHQSGLQRTVSLAKSASLSTDDVLRAARTALGMS